VDTPGQMELFAFRASGPYIVEEMTKKPQTLVYLFDAVCSINPLNYVSNMFLSAAPYNRFAQPQIHVLSKCDLLAKNDLNGITGWSDSLNSLEESIDQLEGEKKLFSRNMVRAISQLGLRFKQTPISAKTNQRVNN